MPSGVMPAKAGIQGTVARPLDTGLRRYDSGKEVLIVAGEASGDLHAAKLVDDLKSKHPNINFTGIGGKAMQQSGVEILIDSATIAVVGFFEIFSHYKQIKHAWRTINQAMKTRKPDLIILVDYPGFNLRLAKKAKKLGIKVLYYISPQVWAWKKGRVKKMKNTIDMMAVVFPFETKYYEKENVPVNYVGHPLLDSVKPSMSKDEFLKQFDIKDKVIALLPGSRHSEIQRLLPVMLETASRLKQQHNELSFILPLASTITKDDIAPYLQEFDVPITLVESNHTYDLMHYSNLVITASGTATLETALAETPMIIIYKMAPLTLMLARKIVKIKFFGLCNIVADKKVAEELLQEDASPDNIQREAVKILFDETYHQKISNNLKIVRKNLQSDKATLSISDLSLSMLTNFRHPAR